MGEAVLPMRSLNNLICSSKIPGTCNLMHFRPNVTDQNLRAEFFFLSSAVPHTVVGTGDTTQTFTSALMELAF